jgi:hypothetical protein
MFQLNREFLRRNREVESKNREIELGIVQIDFRITFLEETTGALANAVFLEKVGSKF